MSQPIDIQMTSKDVMPLFPSLVWKSQLAKQSFTPLNKLILAKLDELTAGEPPLKPGKMWQTDQHFNEVKGMEDLDRVIRGCTKGALDALKIKHDGFIITGCWANISAPGTPHNIHTHPNNYLSGVYYVNTPAKGNGIFFHDPRPQVTIVSPPSLELSPATAGRIRVEVEPGLLIMFPSWLEHSVDPNLSTENRVSIAFNIMFNNYTEKMSPPRWDGNVALS